MDRGEGVGGVDMNIWFVISDSASSHGHWDVAGGLTCSYEATSIIDKLTLFW